MKKTIHQVLGLAGTVEILKCISEHEKCKYIDLASITGYGTLNTRLVQLTSFKLIKHNIKRDKNGRREWYEITEKGKKFVKILEQLEQLDKEQNLLFLFFVNFYIPSLSNKRAQ
jgi:predicted transcriptional regulator